MNSEKKIAQKYDAIIIGTGPAGIFSALELIKSEKKDIKVLMFDSGNDLRERVANRKKGKNEVMQGWGGAGAFSDGKLTLTADIGGYLSDYVALSTLEKYLREVEELYIHYGTSRNRLVTGKGEAVHEARKTALKYGITLIPYRLLHIGTDRCAQVLMAMYDHIIASSKVVVHFNETVKELVIENGKIEMNIDENRFYYIYLSFAEKSGR